MVDPAFWDLRSLLNTLPTYSLTMIMKCYKTSPIMLVVPCCLLFARFSCLALNAECNVCSGDHPDASVLNPDAIIPLALQFQALFGTPIATGVSCALLEDGGRHSALSPEQCRIIQQDPYAPAVCHCSNLSQEEWLDGYPQDFMALPRFSPRTLAHLRSSSHQATTDTRFLVVLSACFVIVIVIVGTILVFYLISRCKREREHSREVAARRIPDQVWIQDQEIHHSNDSILMGLDDTKHTSSSGDVIRAIAASNRASISSHGPKDHRGYVVASDTASV